MPAPLTILDVTTRAFFEIGAFSPADVIPPDDSNYAVAKFVSLVDSLNSDGANIFAVDFLQVVLVPNVQPLLIGQGVQITAVQADGATPNNGTFTGRNKYKVGDVVFTGGLGVIGGVNFALIDAVVTSATPKQFTAVLQTPGIAVGSTPVNGQAIYSTADDIIPNYLTVGARPIEVIDANIILNNLSPFVKVPLRIRDKDWWIKNTIPTVPTSIPTDLYYNPLFPNGQIYLWPMQNVNYLLELEIMNELTDTSDVTTQFYTPQGYQDFLIYSLAESLCPTYGKQFTATQARLYAKATLRVQNLNSQSPKLATRDMGIPRGGRRGTYFNWLNGSTVNPR